MLARLQQLTTLALLAAALAWAVWLWPSRPVLALLGAGLILLGHALILAAEFVLVWRVNRADPLGAANYLLWAVIEPYGVLWFIYLLPVFFVVTKATRRIPAALIWLAAAALEAIHVSTGWTVIDEFAAKDKYLKHHLVSTIKKARVVIYS